MNMPKENSATDQTKKNKRYAFVQREGDDFTCIKLLSLKVSMKRVSYTSMVKLALVKMKILMVPYL